MIPIKNVYYMLSYAFQVLNKKQYKKLKTEEFENIAELFSEILIITLNSQIKRGLERDYIEKQDTIPTIHGKINITSSITPYIQHRELVCEYDEFTLDSYKNQIIKTTLITLIQENISKKQKKKLKRLLIYFSNVSTIDLNYVNWNIRYHMNNQTYQMIITICQMLYEGLLQNPSKGSMKLLELDEKHMYRLYEKFILEYYKKEHPYLKANASYIYWQLDDNMSTGLPLMKTDITLTHKENILIIDAKYYKNSLQTNYNKKAIHSGNLYQIFTYVKNKTVEVGTNYNVSGMLLYAKTDSLEYPDYTYCMSGNKISAKVLDLNVDFNLICRQLDNIVEKYF